MENLHKYEWELTKSPAGKSQYQPVNASQVAVVPDAHDPAKKHAPFMLTTDLSLRMDPQSTRRSPGGSWTIRRTSRTPSRRRGSSCSTATWARAGRYLGPLVPCGAAALAGPRARTSTTS